MKKALRIAVLASGQGTDFQAMVQARDAGELAGISLVCLGSNRPNCEALKKATVAGIPTFVVEHSAQDSRETYDQKLFRSLEPFAPDFIVLVGYDRLFSAWFVQQFPRKIINVHPSLLPKYPGLDLNVHQAVLEAKETETGMTLHWVDEGMDTGEIICQSRCGVQADDTPQSLKARVQQLEKVAYPQLLRELRDGVVK